MKILNTTSWAVTLILSDTHFRLEDSSCHLCWVNSRLGEMRSHHP